MLAVAAQLLLLPGDPLHRLRAAAGQPLPHVRTRRPHTHAHIRPQPSLCAREHALERAPHTRPAVPATSTSTSAGCQSTSRYAPECMHLWAEPLRRRPPSPLSPTLSAPLRRSVDRWSACRRSLGNASARSSLSTRTTSSTAIWCVTRSDLKPCLVRPVHLCLLSIARSAPLMPLVLSCRNRRTS